MNISDLIEELEKLKKKHGDIPVRTQSLTHLWDPELVVKSKDKAPYVLLNA